LASISFHERVRQPRLCVVAKVLNNNSVPGFPSSRTFFSPSVLEIELPGLVEAIEEHEGGARFTVEQYLRRLRRRWLDQAASAQFAKKLRRPGPNRQAKASDLAETY